MNDEKQPAPKTQDEIDNESFSEWFESRSWKSSPDYIDCWLAGIAYERARKDSLAQRGGAA